MKKTHLIVIGAVVVVLLAILIFLPGKDTNSGKKTASGKKDKDSRTEEQQQLTPPPNERKALHQLLPALEAWESGVKPRVKERLMKSDYLGQRLDTYLDADVSNVFDDWFSLGSMLYLVGEYLNRWDGYKVSDPEDRQMLQNIRGLYGRLSIEKDQASVSVQNSSGRSINYLDQVIAPGKSLTISNLKRNLGNAAIYEGVFGIDGNRFPFNPDLPGAKYNTEKYTWTLTGPSSYKLVINN